MDLKTILEYPIILLCTTLTGNSNCSDCNL